MSDTLATLIGALIGASAAIVGASLPEFLRSKRLEYSAARIVFDELTEDYFRMSAIRDDGFKQLSETGQMPPLLAQHAAWQVHRGDLVKRRRGIEMWAKVQSAHVALEATEYRLALLGSRHGVSISDERWRSECDQALTAVYKAIADIRRIYGARGFTLDAFVIQDARSHNYGVAETAIVGSH
jgi:hypothetical protein